MRLYSKLRKFFKWIWHWVLLVGSRFYLPYQIVINSVQPTNFVLFQLILRTFSLRLFHFLHINTKFMLGSLEAECIIFPWLRRSFVGSVLSVVNFTTLLQWKVNLKRIFLSLCQVSQTLLQFLCFNGRSSCVLFFNFGFIVISLKLQDWYSSELDEIFSLSAVFWFSFHLWICWIWFYMTEFYCSVLQCTLMTSW